MRKAIQRAFGRPGGESWRKSFLRIRARWLRRVRERVATGDLTEREGERISQCPCPNAKTRRIDRVPCGRPGCPSCRYRQMLATSRLIWCHFCGPERDARAAMPIAKRGKRKSRLVLAYVDIWYAIRNALRTGLRHLRGVQASRAIQRVGEFDGAITLTSIHRARRGWRLRIAVLGESKTLVYEGQPQPACLRKLGLTVRWQASIAGVRSPSFSPDRTTKLIAVAMAPSANDDASIRTQRFCAFGTWRSWAKARPSPFPRPIPSKYFRRASRARIEEALNIQVARDRRAIARAIAAEALARMPQKARAAVGRKSLRSLAAYAARTCGSDPSGLARALGFSEIIATTDAVSLVIESSIHSLVDHPPKYWRLRGYSRPDDIPIAHAEALTWVRAKAAEMDYIAIMSVPAIRGPFVLPRESDLLESLKLLNEHTYDTLQRLRSAGSDPFRAFDLDVTNILRKERGKYLCAIRDTVWQNSGRYRRARRELSVLNHHRRDLLAGRVHATLSIPVGVLIGSRGDGRGMMIVRRDGIGETRVLPFRDYLRGAAVNNPLIDEVDFFDRLRGLAEQEEEWRAEWPVEAALANAIFAPVNVRFAGDANRGAATDPPQNECVEEPWDDSFTAA